MLFASQIFFRVDFDSGTACSSVPFDYPDEAASDDARVPIYLVCTALSEILHWITVPSTLKMSAARAHVLRTWLDPVNARHKSLNEIALECDVSRAALSKSLLALRDELGIGLTIGRLQTSRELYRQAQLDSLKNGRHASQQHAKKTSTAR